jgi:small GTP-binding protein
MSETTKNVKIVTVGDGTVGKTCLLITYTTNKFPDTYVPTIFDEYAAEVTVSNSLKINLNLWDTAGQEEYDRLRILSYPQTSVFLLCFSIVQPESFKNIRAKWYPEISYNCPTAKIILVGTKLDLKNDTKILNDLKRQNQRIVSHEDAEALRKEIKAQSYIGKYIYIYITHLFIYKFIQI